MEKNDVSDKSQLPLLHSVRSDVVESDRDLNMAMCAPVAATLKCLPRCSASTPISSGQGFPLVRTLHFSRKMSQRWVLCFSNLFLWKSLELEYYSTESDHHTNLQYFYPNPISFSSHAHQLHTHQILPLSKHSGQFTIANQPTKWHECWVWEEISAVIGRLCKLHRHHLKS